jgi:uncharacterized protein YoxC
MKSKPLVPELLIDQKYIDIIDLYNSFNELSAANDELIASVENLDKKSSMIKKEYADLLSDTNKLLESMNELDSILK